MAKLYGLTEKDLENLNSIVRKINRLPENQSSKRF